MADTLNIVDFECESDVVYTGIADCILRLGIVKFICAIPRGKTFTDAEWDDIIPTLAEMATENPYSTRALPIGPIITMTDNSTESVTENTDYGFIIPVRDGTVVWTLRFDNGIGYHAQLRNIAGKHNVYDFLIGFAGGIMGTTRLDAVSGEMRKAGIRFSFIDVLIPKFASGSVGETYNMTVQIADPDQLMKRVAFKRLDGVDISDVPGVQEVLMSGTVNASPAGSVDLDPRIKYGGKSLVEIYGATPAWATLFIATNFLTGATITITGATIVGGKIRLQADVSDTDYPTATNKWTITPAALSVWAAAGVVGYEISNTVTVTRP